MATDKKILIIEDEKEFAEMLQLRLELSGYYCLVATNTDHGVKAIVQNDIDLIILDLMMPGGGGLSVLERVRLFPDKSSIPVVVLTDHNITSDVKTMIGAFQVSALFSKPYDNDKFIARIQSLIPLNA